MIEPAPEIDLHGLNQNEAMALLQKKLSFYKMQEKLCVVVITGRGHSKKGPDMGIFKQKVPGWLKGVAFSSLVDSVEDVIGNPGALMVWLKLPPKKEVSYLKLVK